MGLRRRHLSPFLRPSNRATYQTEHRVADQVAPIYAGIVLAGLRKAQAIPLAAAQLAFQARNLHAFERAVDWTAIGRVMRERIQAATRATILAAAQAHARLLPQRLLKAESSDDRKRREAEAWAQVELAVGQAFDVTNPYATRWVEEHAAELVSEITSESQAAIRAVILRMYDEGLTVDQAARELRRIIGLTTRQALAVENYRAGFGLAANPDLVAQRVQAYAERALRQRAAMIARTESIRASVAGQQVLWDEAVRTGLLEGDRVTQRWLVTPDERLCPICEALGREDPVPLGQAFPGGFSGPPAHPNCRCALRLVFAT